MSQQDHTRESQAQSGEAPRRRRRRRRSPVLSALLYVACVLAVSVILACVAWVAANDVLALNKAERSATIVITDDDSFSQVADQLKEEGIIQYKGLFNLFASFTHAKDDISAGTYVLNTDMDYRAILSNIGSKSTARVEVSVTIPEGYSVQQIFQLLEDEGVSTVDKLNDMAATHDYQFSFLADIPLGEAERLEGYLYPDTYNFYLNQDPLRVINKMLQGFDARVTDEMREEVAAGDYSLYEILTIASLIEKETDGTDRAHIASVIYNRLKNVNSAAGTNGYLQIDATLAYINGGKVPTEADKSIDSPYNTYLYPGLPAGPIANPGLESIQAAMNPDSTKDYYYTLGDDNKHHFFQTYAQMQSFMATQERYK
jgi:UPF0755 protein